MVGRLHLQTCVECGEATTERSLICSKCAPLYEAGPTSIEGDENDEN